jgi:hypothetical protein
VLATRALRWCNGLVTPRDDRNAPLGSFLRDLFAQLFSAGARIDSARCCAYSAFLGLLLLIGALALRLAGPSDPLGGLGFMVVVTSAVVLLAALVVPVVRPRLVPTLLAVQGVVIVALSAGFALACAVWALGTPATGSFRYLPGVIVVGVTYGAALWADFGPARAHPRPWRLAGFIAGVALEAAVAALVVGVVLRR